MRPWTVLGVAVTSGVSAVVVVELLGPSDSTMVLVSNLVMFASATLAFVACTLAARRSAGRRRAMWMWMAVGTGAWTAGQLVYGYYVLVLGLDLPFPSPADAAFLTFPLAASVGMVIWLGSHGHQLAARGRDVLDGAIIAGSLLVISWVTALGAAVDAGGTWFSLTVSLAYPVGDLVLVTLVFMALVRGAPQERFTLAVLALGLGGVSISDSAYVYSVNQATSWPTDVFGMGWFFGFLFVAAAATSAKSAADVVPVARGAESSTHDDLTPPSLLRLALPYLPLVAALAAFVASVVRAPGGPDAGLLLGVALVLIVLTRQFLAMFENFRLILAVQEARDQLKHQATHDPLTGLPNRVLFADRLDRALLEPAANVSVLFCDLDDFKQVNDKFGHETGDVLLRTLAERLLACVRITDTVSRLGGDEFALLLIDSADPAEITGRVLSSLSEPVDISGNTISISVSIGVAHHRPATPSGDRRGPASQPVRRTARPGPDSASTRATTAQLLMRTADSAMYVAKGAGKGQAVFAGTATAHETAGAGVTGAAGP